MKIGTSSTQPQARKPLELWAGFECTVNRLQDGWMDQLELSGHAHRDSDLDLLTEIGAKAVRYPLLWERLAPAGLHNIDWTWSDRRLNRLRELGIRPIVGLVHHGSGPEGTHLLDPQFAEKLASFAAAVAERYPWIDAYTPVNEPLTTARFSCLYGHWYPHRRSEQEFLRAILNETRATILAMQAIRGVNPSAQLVHTEDLGKTHSTSHLQYQADFENERRWLSVDLLSGQFGQNSRLWNDVVRWGAGISELEWFQQNACTPDVLGFNYYLSSERFLDQRTHLYPNSHVGGNSFERYVDVEAARVLHGGISGLAGLLREAWDRYQLPLCVTELHNGCTREEQLRWFVEQWHEARRLAGEGVDIRAVTAWALLGSFNWNTLVTCQGKYEPGVYDVRAPKPWPTAMVAILQQLSTSHDAKHPVLDTRGWWRRPQRFFHEADLPQRRPENLRVMSTHERPILITGRTGTLGRAFARICEDRGLAHHLLRRAEMDIADPVSVWAAIDRWRPWAIVNAAGYVRVDDAEIETDSCFRENAVGATVLAQACRDHGVKLVTFSSDLVFDGESSTPYVESSKIHPLNAYGRSKVAAEESVLSLFPAAMVVRTSAFFGPWDEHNFVTRVLQTLACGNSFAASSDHYVSPTYVPDLVHNSLDLLIDGAAGLWHLANEGCVSWAGLALTAARMAGVSTAKFSGFKNHEWTFPAPRPRYAVLGSERHSFMPPLTDALQRYLLHPELVWKKAECIGRAEESGELAA